MAQEERGRASVEEQSPAGAFELVMGNRKQYTRKEASKITGIPLGSLGYLSLKSGVQPERKILRGRATNFYSHDDLKRIKEAAKLEK